MFYPSLQGNRLGLPENFWNDRTAVKDIHWCVTEAPLLSNHPIWLPTRALLLKHSVFEWWYPTVQKQSSRFVLKTFWYGHFSTIEAHLSVEVIYIRAWISKGILLTMVKYNSTVNIYPLCPWVCVNSLPTPCSDYLRLALDVIKCTCFAYKIAKCPSIALGLVNALCYFAEDKN